MLLADLARTSQEVAATSSRTEKAAALARLFRAAEPADAPVVITHLAGRLPQRRTGLGWRSLAERPEPAATPRLTVREVDAALTAIAGVSGKGATAERRRRWAELLARATDAEQDFLVRLVGGELRQGALDALAVEGLAAATGTDPADLRRAVMLGGSLGAVASAVLAGGPDSLTAFRLEVGRPIQPMLAQSATDVAQALDRLGPCAVEEKLDGIRVQLHRDGGRVRVWTRTLEEITERLPEVVAAGHDLAAERAVLDGEVIAPGPDGRPRPFQEVSGRVATRSAGAENTLPVRAVFFDLLSVDDRDLLDRPTAERHAELVRLLPAEHRVRRLVVEDPSDPEQRRVAEAFTEEVIERGHEGVLVKSLEAGYTAGRRGAAWVKVKPVHTLDLVVLAAEWGNGRRAGFLSNLHLGARRPDGGFAMLGKTFKGMTDETLTWQTERLRELALPPGEADPGNDYTVPVRPELVVEIAFDGVQRSSRYPEGVTLRFARLVRYREDKGPQEADTVDDVLALLR
ncbi:ATP-dependent DNA ligase [Streptomyces alkaliphilus]|uniref:Probable DNA ligase n=1 Tax=Streptomyces alkaliphilus TaxID=1472722 RepID=A0A7W3TC30_9ACTN|nr:ATP-dependent DNA ligase [Streptomyces alkaliphilus]MBB0243735.1 ATP-dependent DNA ligase [Streptomyces alkaliphilus]